MKAKIMKSIEQGPERGGDKKKCLACDGTGKIGDKTCPSCNGTGTAT